VLPLAADRKIKICIETVGNNFITKPEQMISFVNNLASPWAGAYFDSSNMIRHGVSSAERIRRLGIEPLANEHRRHLHPSAHPSPVRVDRRTRGRLSARTGQAVLCRYSLSQLLPRSHRPH
jgi:hypothetical protein